MAHPRRIVPAETYLVTRRCYQRTFRLRPADETNRIFRYCLAFAAKKTGVLIHAACVMSNHHHLVVTDVHGVLPEFLRELHRLTAKAVNASQAQWENLWAAEPCNVVRLVTADDVCDKIEYVVANPVAGGLVKKVDEWPGVVHWGEQLLRAPRPGSYFREHGVCDAELELRFELPALATEGGAASGASWKDRVRNAIARKVAEAHRAVAAAGRRFLGADAVRAASFRQQAVSYEKRFGIIPTFAARAREVRRGLRRVERHFRERYRHALTQWRAGVRTVLFPAGTWGMKLFHAALVEPLPAGPQLA